MAGKLIGTLTALLELDNRQFNAATRQSIQQMTKFSGSLRQVGADVRSLGRGLSASITAPIALLGGVAVKTAAEFETAKIAFGTFVGDMKRGEKIFKSLTQFASKTPLNLSSIQKAAQVLLATGIEADNLMGILKNLGDVSRGDSDILQSLALNLGQVRAQGKLTGRELRDFSTRGVPLLQVLASQMGKNEAEIQAMVSAGKIGFNDVTAAFKAMSGPGGKFENLLAKMANTLTGKFTTALDNVKITLASFIDPVREPLKRALDLVTRLSKKFRELSPSIKRAIVIFLGIAAAIGPILVAVGGLMAGFGFMVTGFVAFKVVILAVGGAIMGAIVSPLGIAVAALIAVGAVFIKVFNVDALGAVKNFASKSWKFLKSFAINVVGFMVNFRENWAMLVDWFGRNWMNMLSDMIAGAIIFLVNLGANFTIGLEKIIAMFGAFTGFMIDNWEVMLGHLLNKLIEWGIEFVTFFFQIGQRVRSAIEDAFTGDLNLEGFGGAFIKGAAEVGTLQERIEGALGKTTEFRKALEGFGKTTEDLPEFNLKMGTIFDTKEAEEAAKKTGATIAKAAATVSEAQRQTLGSGAAKGSVEAFRIIAQGQNTRTEKQIEQNTGETKEILEDIRDKGIKINVKAAGIV